MRLPITASGMSPAASTMPAAMAQNRKAMSMGSLMAVRKRTMDRGAYHAQGEDDVAGHRQDQQGGDEGEGDEGVTPKLGAYMTPA